jgi:hypothetical protein
MSFTSVFLLALFQALAWLSPLRINESSAMYLRAHVEDTRGQDVDRTEVREPIGIPTRALRSVNVERTTLSRAGRHHSTGPSARSAQLHAELFDAANVVSTDAIRLYGDALHISAFSRGVLLYFPTAPPAFA